MNRNEAIEIVRKHYPDDRCLLFNEALETLIPELKESDYERIRNRIIGYLKQDIEEHPERKERIEDMLAWIKKQGEKEYALKSTKDVDVHKFVQYIERQAKAYELNLPNRSYDIYGFAKDILSWLEEQGEQKLFNNDEYQTVSVKILDRLYESEKELERLKQGEPFKAEHGKYYYCIKDYFSGGKKQASKGDVVQALRGLPIMGLDDASDFFLPVNDMQLNNGIVHNVSPKFKVGDWVVFLSSSTLQIVKIDLTSNYYWFNDGSFLAIVDEDCLRPWTIKDAKDGDVLAEHETIVLFKKIEGLNIRCYCTYHYLGYNPTFYVDTLQNKTPYRPATKEQRDLLFQKMKEAGYEWDADKKELIKLELNPDELAKGEDYGIDGLWHAQRILEKTFGKVEGYQTDDGILSHECAISAVKELYEKEPAWSEEDKKMINNIGEYLNCYGNYIVESNEEKAKEIYKSADWFKSLKDKSVDFDKGFNVGFSAAEFNQWKPSDGQMIALKGMIDSFPQQETLRSLYVDLKKLKG